MVSSGLDSRLRAMHRLPLSEFDLLRALAQPGCAQRMAGLAGAVGLSPSGLTRAIERLERRGLVSRVACQEDRRGTMAELTVAGTALLLEASVTHDAALRRLLLDHLSAAESAQLSHICQRLAEQEAAGCPTGGASRSASHQPGQSGCPGIHGRSEGDNQHT